MYYLEGSGVNLRQERDGAQNKIDEAKKEGEKNIYSGHGIWNPGFR